MLDLIEIDGKDLRSTPIEERKRVLANLLHRERDGIVLNVHYYCDGDGAALHAEWIPFRWSFPADR
jgi:ATP-dependent DNA ligase